MWKGETGLMVYEGPLADGQMGGQFTDGVLSAQFQKTADPEVFFGLAGRVQDKHNHYSARFSGTAELALIKVTGGEPQVLAALPTRNRYQEGQVWSISMTFDGPRITAQVFDESGVEQARVDAKEDKAGAPGAAGLQATNFTGAKDFRIASMKPVVRAPAPPAKEDFLNKSVVDDLVLHAAQDVEKLNTPYNKLASSYDIVVAGAGTGGWAAAIQAARMGAKVLLLEETDWIGGQMAAAGVTSMDEEGLWDKYPVRERGIYREFHGSIANFYYTASKDPFRAYYNVPEQTEGGYEPKIARAILYSFITEARKTGVLDLSTATAVTKVIKDGDKITGVEIGKDGARKTVDCKVLVEATEYGDILPLTGARYRAGTVTSENLAPDSPVQADTYVGVIREYPGGVPGHLQIKEPPPGYDAEKYARTQLYGPLLWGGPSRGHEGPRTYRVMLAWRGMADIDSPSTGILSAHRHTQCGLNDKRLLDYPMDVASLENMEARRAGQVDGIHRTLGLVYYLQQELGLPWGLAEDEGYNTPYNVKSKAALDLRPDLAALAAYLPQVPYVRESRRGRGIYTLRTSDMGRFENARLWPTAVAMVDYFMDTDHGGTGEHFEEDLDAFRPPRQGGPAQVPFEVFVPEKIDGFVLAEKNLSQSRIVNGTTRLQPSTMLTGQAAGTIAALAALDGIQPRDVNPIRVQAVLLDAGSNLVQRWYDDVTWGSPLWKATQLLSLHSVMDVPGPYVTDEPKAMGAGNVWNPSVPLDAAMLNAVVKRLAESGGINAHPVVQNSFVNWQTVGAALESLDPQWKSGLASWAVTGPVTRGKFALAAAEVLKHIAKPVLVTDASVETKP